MSCTKLLRCFDYPISDGGREDREHGWTNVNAKNIKSLRVWKMGNIVFLHCMNVLEWTEVNECVASNFNSCLSADVLMCPFLESISSHYRPQNSDASHVDKSISEQQKHYVHLATSNPKTVIMCRPSNRMPGSFWPLSGRPTAAAGWIRASGTCHGSAEPFLMSLGRAGTACWCKSKTHFCVYTGRHVKQAQSPLMKLDALL